MLSEQTIERLTERLVKRIESQNIQIIKQIGQSIIKLGQLSPSKAQQLIQILRYGGDYDKIIREIKRITKLNIKDIEQIFREVAKQDYQFAEQFYKYRNKKYIPFDENKQLQNQLKALTKAAVKDYYNLTKSSVIGFTSINPINNKVIFKDLQQTYIDALDQAVLSISQGKTTFQDQLHQIVRTLGKSGLKTVDYESGRSMRLDSAVRMNMKGALRNLHNETQKIIGEQFDADGVEISVHANPAPDHQEVQGRQFTIGEYNKLNEGLDAKDYNGNVYTLDHDHKNGYRPISEMNCYHYIFSIILGVSKPEYSDKQLQNIIDRNDEGFDFEGKHYTMYEGTQLQRMIERKIREQKDIQILARSDGDDILAGEAQNKITILTRKYKQLNDESGLLPKIERMSVAQYRRSSKATKAYQNEINKMKIGSFDASQFGNEFNPTTKDVILMPERKKHIYNDHPKDADKYFDRMKDVLNNYDNAYKENGKKGTIWLTKKYDDYELNLIVKINETSLYQRKQLGYKNSIITFHPMRKNYIKNSLESKKIKRLIDNKKNK